MGPIPNLRRRTRQLGWLRRHDGVTEQPPGSNRDDRVDGIAAAQRRLGSWLVGLAWCGIWAARAMLHAGVDGVTWRLASVSMIEDDARAGRRPFRAWTTQHSRARRGDLVVLFGRGVHVETIVRNRRRRGYLITRGGNTSREGDLGGSQSNGGGAFRRRRPLNLVHGYALVDYTQERQAQAPIGVEVGASNDDLIGNRMIPPADAQAPDAGD